MLILGIDPGTATTGYGLIKTDFDKMQAIDFGLVETDKNGSSGKRLLHIYDQIVAIIKRLEPDTIAIERLFFASNAKTAMSVGQALGVMILAATKCKKNVFEYAPGTIKKIISGDGKADKKKIQKSLRIILGAGVRSRARKRTHFDNAADALAVAVCHARMVKEGG